MKPKQRKALIGWFLLNNVLGGALYLAVAHSNWLCAGSLGMMIPIVYAVIVPRITKWFVSVDNPER